MRHILVLSVSLYDLPRGFPFQIVYEFLSISAIKDTFQAIQIILTIPLVKVVLVYVTRHVGGLEVWCHSFLNLSLDLGEWSASSPGHFSQRERAPGFH